MNFDSESLQEAMSNNHLNVYLAGPLSDFDGHEEVHKHIINECHLDIINFVDPLILEAETTSGWEVMRRDLRAVEQCDAVFAYRAGVETWGTKAEIFHALRVGTPVVIYDITPRQDNHNHWMTDVFTVINSFETATEAIVAKALLYK